MQNDNIAKVEIEINAPVEKVWRALTTPSMIKHFLFGTEVVSDWKEGSSIKYKGEWNGTQYEDKGTILKMIPNKLFVSTYWSSMGGKEDKPENYNTVSYKLESIEGKTKLILEQDKNASQEDKAHSEQNWQKVLVSLKKLLE